jgi:hypothetical protein
MDQRRGSTSVLVWYRLQPIAESRCAISFRSRPLTLGPLLGGQEQSFSLLTV